MHSFACSNSVDSILDSIIEKSPQLDPVQYSIKLQIVYLKRLAIKYGLYDAADALTKTFQV
jgi:hypothetical protein